MFKGVCTIDDEGKMGRSMLRGKWRELYHKQSLVFWSPLVGDLYKERALRLGKDVVEDDNDLSHYY